MPNDIENDICLNQINISEVNKYNKFIDFGISQNEHPHFSGLFHFTTNELKKEKLGEDERFLAMKRMQGFLDKKIEDELKQDQKLQEKIEIIEDKVRKYKEKARLRIKKLVVKPKKKIQEKYNYKRMEDYFDARLMSEEEF